MKLGGLGRKIAVSMAELALGIMLIVVLMTYVFYYVMLRHWGEFCHQASWIPSTPEWICLGITLLIGLILAIVVSTRLAHRILVPLNSVADSIRRVARGDLTARAVAGDRSIREAALIADDFNALAAQLQRMTDEQAFWNAAIAHELRTPVTVLRGRLQGLAEGVFQPGEALFRSLLTQAEGLTRLIEDLRVISLAESGHLSVSLQETDLAEHVKAVVEMFEDSLAAAGQHMVLDLDTRPVHCDAFRMRQALLALLENARRYAVPGAIRIHTRVENGTCHLQVEDEGPGIPADYAAQIFDAFRRVDDTHSDQKGGSGLGLAVVAAIAQAHDGEASCRPTARGGTSFALHWPDRPASAHTAAPSRKDPPPTTQRTVDTDPR
ncbi:MAG: ATP-binding protein [Burkholderia contaminans]|uniref:Signal transduction histidine-protein kinase/phosphatase MprB n=1 Tax=Burkholderia contaminans TaxID=488447 RepID=A0AAP4RAJ4_9BURK|nr:MULTISPECIES: ATP-binding protein [Burkholderia]MBD1413654.1 HAMP domain-containing histidine kinase [Burkholderia contaminans]MBH9669231.1 HAMP domain-containing histidine kinase [Burkholderia contaminans]MBH9676215.1 HAMP domain-containing histidine kinase [Burkholderia contaminans]MBH9706639.1 HAMP domain-containing histidine kinase [Burkholderia contaminans]MBM6425764.1 HAMP domain-containing histidine kinase [Burkholderia contaminans]